MENDADEPHAENTNLKIICPFCNEPWNARMFTDFDYSMGSEWTGIYGDTETVKIYCSNCKKLVYSKG